MKGEEEEEEEEDEDDEIYTPWFLVTSLTNSKFYQVNLQERDRWGGLGVDGRAILEWTLKK